MARNISIIISIMLIGWMGCSHTDIPRSCLVPSSQPLTSEGKLVKVSFYGKGDFFKDKKTACGERFNPSALTAAHRSLPFGSTLKLTNPNNGKSVIVRINDRGPFVKGRTLDISSRAAELLDIYSKGVATLIMEQIS